MRHNPPPDACVCGRCGQPYAPNGAEESTLVEIEVKAHKRVIRRSRWRRACECASSPMEVSARPVPRLFPRTLYGTSFWARFLFEHCACFRPLHRVAAWFSSQGLPVSPGTLADSLKRFVPLFEPLAAAILAHQNKAVLRHADETGWRVQELRGEDRSSRAWLWASVSSDTVSARFTAIMYSVVGTLSMNGIDILSWLDAWLAACAENDRKPPGDLSSWLPWSMSEERRRELMAPA